MLKIIYAQKIGSSLSLDRHKSAEFLPGMIAQSKTVKDGKGGGHLMVIVSDGTGKPIGLIDDIYTKEETSIRDEKVCIRRGRIIFKTDQFEPNEEYLPTADLYVSKNGLLTTNTNYNQKPVAILIKKYKNHNCIKAIWLK